MGNDDYLLRLLQAVVCFKLDTNPPSISQYFQPQSLYIPPGKQASIAVYPNNYGKLLFCK